LNPVKGMVITMSAEYENNLVLVEKFPNKVAKVTLNNPPLNICTLDMMQELKNTLKKINADPDIYCMILCGNEKAFCVGSNLKEIYKVCDDVVDKKLFRENETFNMLEYNNVVSIAALEGVACGGGVEMSLACDMRIMASDARLALPEVNSGLRPGSGCFRLPKLAGPSKALELMLTGEFISAAEALGIRMVNRISEPGKAFDAAMEIADKITHKSRHSVQLIRRSVREMWLKTSEECFWQNLHFSAEIYDRDEWKEGVNAFMEKRKPDFTKFW